MTEYWRRLSGSLTGVDRVVAGLHEVELLESMTSYTNADELYFPRITAALEQLPEEHWDAALAVFASVIYIPHAFLSATYDYLWWSVQTMAAKAGTPISKDAQDVHIMEVDADGLVPDFARQNGLSARLNAAVHPRLPDVQQLRQALKEAASEIGEARRAATDRLRLAASKNVWIVLTDKALSGQSLLGDLQKIMFARDLLGEVTGKQPTVYVCAQIATSIAERAVADWIRLHKIRGVHMISAIRLDEQARVGSEQCRLFVDEETRRRVLNLCSWFDREVVSKDVSLNTFRERSGGTLALGYKGTGITLVDHLNAPTNSLPLLWFDGTDPAGDYTGSDIAPKYRAPFPRVHSRRGAEVPGLSEGSLWSDLMQSEARQQLVDRMNN